VNQPPSLPYAGAQSRYQGLELKYRDGVLTRVAAPDLTDEERYGRKLASGLATNLGKNPVIIYRMRPWRAEPLSDFVSKTVGRPDQVTLVSREGGIVEETRTQNALGSDNFNLDTFPGTTWRYDDAPRVDKSALIGLDFAVDDMNHANTVTVGLPTQADSPVRFMQRLGLPFYSDNAILTRGVRLYQPQWPFFPPVDNRSIGATSRSILGGVVGVSRQSNMLRDMRTIALLAMQYMAGADRFENGSVLLEYSPQVRHGEPIRIGMPKGVPGDSKELVGYVERSAT
jgi:hypothetical protein